MTAVTGRGARTSAAPASRSARERYSPRTVGKARLDVVVESGDGYLATVPHGGHLRLVDLHGSQVAAALLFDAADLANRYSAVDTVREQGVSQLSRGSVLLSARLDPLARIVADSCGRHDTLTGVCAQESNAVRFGEHTRHQHACRETFLRYGAARGIGARELSAGISFFKDVAVAPSGELALGDGTAAPGRHVELRTERDVLVLVSCCPQLNDASNGWNPTPVRLLGWW